MPDIFRSFQFLEPNQFDRLKSCSHKMKTKKEIQRYNDDIVLQSFEEMS